VLGLGLAAVLTGCGAGQISQTATQVSSVNGASGSVGPIAIRDTQLAAPGNAQQTYPPGSSARLIVTIVNTGLAADTLVKVTSPAVTTITIDGSDTGTKALPDGFAVASGVDTDDMTVNPTGGSSVTEPTTTPTAISGANTPSGSSSPSGSTSPSTAKPSASRTPLPPGKVTIELVGIKSINGGALRAGMTIPVTFYFAHAGQVTLPQVPLGAPADGSSLLSSAANG
jgi:copper(I)-binding protein